MKIIIEFRKLQIEKLRDFFTHMKLMNNKVCGAAMDQERAREGRKQILLKDLGDGRIQFRYILGNRL